jgi:hypothetical protein
MLVIAARLAVVGLMSVRKWQRLILRASASRHISSPS